METSYGPKIGPEQEEGVRSEESVVVRGKLVCLTTKKIPSWEISMTTPTSGERERVGVKVKLGEVGVIKLLQH